MKDRDKIIKLLYQVQSGQLPVDALFETDVQFWKIENDEAVNEKSGERMPVDRISYKNRKTMHILEKRNYSQSNKVT